MLVELFDQKKLILLKVQELQLVYMTDYDKSLSMNSGRQKIYPYI